MRTLVSQLMLISFGCGADRRRQGCDIGADRLGRILAVLADQFDDRRADHDAVGDARDRGGLVGRADAEADRDGQVGRGLEPGDGFLDRGLRGLLLAGDPGDRDVIEEPARAIEHGGQARGVGGRGGEADQVDPGGAQRGAERIVFLGRDIDADHAIDAGFAGSGRRTSPRRADVIGLA